MLESENRPKWVDSHICVLPPHLIVGLCERNRPVHLKDLRLCYDEVVQDAAHAAGIDAGNGVGAWPGAL